jgi:hypothetical protein
MSELLPCPFCGGPASDTEVPGRVHFYACDICVIAFESKEEWNRRYPVAPPPGDGGLREGICVSVGEPVFSFADFDDWCDNARHRFSSHGMHSSDALCVDRSGRVCTKGAEFMRARDEGTFPILVYRVGIPAALAPRKEGEG